MSDSLQMIPLYFMSLLMLTSLLMCMLNHDLKTIENWAFQWKMSLNPYPTKQAEQVIFSSKSIKAKYPPIYFSNSAVVTVPHHKHIGLVLDESLTMRNISKKLLLRREEAQALLDLWHAQDMCTEMFLIKCISYTSDPT